ncbi:hypothetical protein Bhyg_09657, partial [Pseudolycoriella hygida]
GVRNFSFVTFREINTIRNKQLDATYFRTIEFGLSLSDALGHTSDPGISSPIFMKDLLRITNVTFGYTGTVIFASEVVAQGAFHCRFLPVQGEFIADKPIIARQGTLRSFNMVQ